jgi:predicted ATPase
MTTADIPAVIRGIHVRSYKNLQDVWLPWSDGIAIFGANGTGKTNLLESLALLFGNEETLRLASPRLNDVTPDNFSAVIEVPDTELPWAPDLLQHFDADADADATWNLLGHAAADARWWMTIGVASGATFLDAMERIGVPELVLDYLSSEISRPTIRYTLARADFVRLAFDGPEDLPTLTRHFNRTLLGRTPPADVIKLVDQLPDVFAPLRTALGAPQPSTPTGMVTVMVLPGVPQAPINLQWLPRARTSQEADTSLVRAFRDAYPSAVELEQSILDLGVAGPLDQSTGAAHWWLHEVIADTANHELAQTVPGHVHVIPDGSDDADIRLADPRTTPNHELGRSGDDNMLDLLSAGERRWTDEALAAAAAELVAVGQRAHSQARLLSLADQTQLLAALITVTDAVQELIDRDSFFSAEALQRVRDTIEPTLRSAAQAQLDQQPNPLTRSLVEALLGLEVLRPKTTIRLFDEPEAHLHPSAQRVVAAALETLRRAGNNILIATHSPQFLDMPGWDLVHLQRTPEGTTLSPLQPADLDARKALAAQLGLTRGELLARVNYILVVEGEHDRLVLETLYGTQLDEAGIQLLRMHGTQNILATAELDFISHYLDAPVGVLTDYTRIDKVNSKAPTADLNDEERALRYLRRACTTRKRTITMFGLKRPDITAYLNADAVRLQAPAFPGWAVVLQRFEERHARPSFKPWLLDKFQVDLVNGGQIAATLAAMKKRDLPAEGDLPSVVDDIIRVAAVGHWPGASA